MPDLIPIVALPPGEVAQVRQIVGRPEQVRRMEELGVRSGVMLEMVQGGRPCIVRVGTAKLCLREGEMCSVLVAARIST